MDAHQDQHPPMPGDDELAKALQGGLQFEETPVPGAGADQAPATAEAPQEQQQQQPAADPASTDAPDPLTEEPPTLGIALPQPDDALDDDDAPTIKRPHEKAADDDKPSKKKDDDLTMPSFSPTPAVNMTSAGSGPLDKLKASALEELRPLVGKLNLPAEEKFDTLLLIIRSTDDQSLLDEAHAAAKDISDDAKRAQALLDIIKEIDYFSSKR